METPLNFLTFSPSSKIKGGIEKCMNAYKCIIDESFNVYAHLTAKLSGSVSLYSFMV